MNIRQETEKDFSEIYSLVKTAFETSTVADGDEHDYVTDLRKSENYISELALVLEDEGAIIGHIMFTRTYVTQKNAKFEALLLSPVCVKLEYRNKGVGSRFIKACLEKAKEKGFKAVFLAGNPAYYQRIGFKPISNYAIKHIGDISEQYIMAYELEQDALKNVEGTISIY